MSSRFNIILTLGNVVLTLGIVGLLSGCGASQVLTAGCGGDLDDLCTMVFGPEQPGQDEFDDLSQRVLDLEDSVSELANSILELEAEYGANENQILQIENELLQVQSELAELAVGARVEQYIDPCGDAPGQFDEVLLLMTDGTLVAYFQNGSRRFLTVLPDGSYQTTDFQRCAFRVISGVYSE